ncbi:MAG: phospho-sugar mutase [Clostridia bacterium]|nr:phospho-sugar mutase [Clostridia bacterium]
MDHKMAYNEWLSSPKMTAAGVEELKSVSGDESAIEYRFGAELKFGTAGMRGLIGMGTNMMNEFTVMRATKGLAEYVRSLGKYALDRGVAISYDTRRMSERFACAAAGVLIKNGIKVYIYEHGRPVPMLSYAVRKLNAIAGIMITASHNPKEYNGYKVYGEDGAQMSPEATEVVVGYISSVTDYFSVEAAEIESSQKADKAGAIVIGKKFEQEYYKELYKLSLSPAAVKSEGKNVKLVYTPVHGTGYVPVTTVLNKLGIKVSVVEEQTAPDPEFSTVELPNPEFKETLSMGIALANKIKADVVFGTDPDCDRLGVALRNDDGEFVALSGNQVGVLLLNYILTRLKEDGKLSDDCFAVKSFVSTNLAKSVCDSFGVELKEVPVGFKYIGEKIKISEETGKGTFVFGFEESCGYLRGTHARDKDAVVASMLFAELVCYYKSINVTVFEVLNGIYKKFGYCMDKTESIAYKGLFAMDDMKKAVQNVSAANLTRIGDHVVLAVRNYETGVRRDKNGNETPLEFNKLNCLYYELENGFVCLRPSGTEPKLKIYYSIGGRDGFMCADIIKELSNSIASILGASK